MRTVLNFVACGAHTVAVRNPGGMAMPFDVVVTFEDGTTERVHRTPAVWQADGRRTEVRVAGGKALRSVNLDTGIFLDANPGDNTWTAAVSQQPTSTGARP